MLSGIFGKDNDIIIWIILILLLTGGLGDGLFGGKGRHGIFGDDIIIWIVLLFFLLGDHGKKRKI